MFKGKDQIYYILGILSTLLIFLFISNVSVLAGKPATYLILLILVTLNVWFGGKKLGIFTALICLVHFLLFYILPVRFNSLNAITSIYESVLFGIISLLISYFIEKYKKTDIVRFHINRENDLIKQIIENQRKQELLQKEVKMRDEFLSIASHELKTPLTSMLLKIQTLLHNIRNVSLANFSVGNLMQQLETAEGQTKRLSQMINDLQNVSLITTGRMRLEKKAEDLTEIVKEVISEFSEKLQRDGIKLNLIKDKPVQAFVDKIRIEQVLTNLLSNAIKYGKKKPIDIIAERNNSKVFITVKDHGIGIPPNQKEKIFHLFERGINGKDLQGLGVGLYIANQIIKAHNGKIKVNSSLNSGSEFIIELPLK